MARKGQYKYTKETLQDKLNLIDNNVEIVGEYKGVSTQIKTKCKKCGYIWNPLPTNLLRGQTGCPCCLGQVAVKGINSFYDTHYNLALLLENIEDSYVNLKYSKRIVNWVCPCCKTIVKRSFERITQVGHIPCPICNDGLSFPNKFMASCLKQLHIDFDAEKTFHWSNQKRYDFYIEKYNCIIEVHGAQHYDNKGFMYGHEYQIKNDNYKRQMALNNGIDLYIEIDARKSEKDFIFKSIINSPLAKIFDLSVVDWNQCNLDCMKSLKLEACALWNDGMRNTTEIGKVLGVHGKTVRSYLKECANMNMCDYDSHKAMIVNGKNSNPPNKRKVICTTTNELFESISSAKKKYNISTNANIISCCQGKRNYAGTLPDGTPLVWKYAS